MAQLEVLLMHPVVRHQEPNAVNDAGVPLEGDIRHANERVLVDWMSLRASTLIWIDDRRGTCTSAYRNDALILSKDVTRRILRPLLGLGNRNRGPLVCLQSLTCKGPPPTLRCEVFPAAAAVSATRRPSGWRLRSEDPNR